MDCLKAVQAYVDKAITQARGIKVLLLDQDTVSWSLLRFKLRVESAH